MCSSFCIPLRSAPNSEKIAAVRSGSGLLDRQSSVISSLSGTPRLSSGNVFFTPGSGSRYESIVTDGGCGVGLVHLRLAAGIGLHLTAIRVPHVFGSDCSWWTEGKERLSSYTLHPLQWIRLRAMRSNVSVLFSSVSASLSAEAVSEAPASMRGGGRTIFTAGVV